MSVETHRVLMGTVGWKYQDWLHDFYSEDLPEDWQLGFYSNEFPVVYVPASDWIEESGLDEWEDEVEESFRFILEVPADVILEPQRFTAALKKAKILGNLCLGLVFQVNQVVMENVTLFERHLATAFVPVCIDKQDVLLTEEFKEILAEKNISEVWDGKSAETESLKRGSLAISHVYANDLNMKELRKVVDTSLSASSEDCISVLCLDGNPPSLENLRNAETILNLL